MARAKAKPRGGPRPVREQVVEHAWCVELPTKRRPEGWFIATTSNGPAVFYGLDAARSFCRELRQHLSPTGVCPFRRARVRRVKLAAWGCAV